MQKVIEDFEKRVQEVDNYFLHLKYLGTPGALLTLPQSLSVNIDAEFLEMIKSGRVGKRAPRSLTLSAIYPPACPPFLNGGQQKDVAHPTWLLFMAPNPRRKRNWMRLLGVLGKFF